MASTSSIPSNPKSNIEWGTSQFDLTVEPKTQEFIDKMASASSSTPPLSLVMTTPPSTLPRNIAWVSTTLGVASLLMTTALPEALPAWLGAAALSGLLSPFSWVLVGVTLLTVGIGAALYRDIFQQKADLIVINQSAAPASTPANVGGGTE